MEENMAAAITTVKQGLRLNEWTAQVKAQQASGLTVQQWCAENGISSKTYYYRLRKVREQCVSSAHTTVPLTMPRQNKDIVIEKNDLHISLPADISSETLIALVHSLC